MFVIFSVLYILIAAVMIVLILMQRGSGADAGSGFGGGSLTTVFGARGSANFMSRATAVLAVLFFLLSLGMGIYLKMNGVSHSDSGSDLGVMAGLNRRVTPAGHAQSTRPVAPGKTVQPAPASSGRAMPTVPAGGKVMPGKS